MSDTRIRPQQGRTLTPEQLAWNARLFQQLGWQSKRAQQQQLRNDIHAKTREVEQTVLRAGQGTNCFTAIDQEDLDPGKEFREFKRQLSYFERATQEARPGLAESLRIAAQGYIDHYNKHSKRQKKQSKNQRKLAICQSTLDDLRKFDMGRELRELGDPPWNSVASMKAASLKANLDIETLANPEAQEVEGLHATPAYWINAKQPNQGNDQQQTQHSYLFKPKTTVPPDLVGFPRGGDIAREAMTGRIGDLLNGMTGLDFGVPETNVVAIGRDKVPGSEGNEDLDGFDNPGSPIVGSAQQFATTQGGLRGKPTGERAQINGKSAQKMMVLDMLSLNLDRHPDNALLKPNQTGGNDIVPIDHGACLPGKAGLFQLPNRMGSDFNAMLSIPGSHEPFDQEVLDAIDDIDPDAMALAMKNERGVMERVHPSTRGTISDETIEMTRRSAKFLKLGAAFDPSLTAAAIQVALGQYGEELLDPAKSEQEFERRADEVLTEIAGEQDGIKDYMLMSAAERKEMKQVLVGNGWGAVIGGPAGEWTGKNLTFCLKLYRGDVMHPAKYDLAVKELGKNLVTQLLQTMSLQDIVDNRVNLARQHDVQTPQAPPTAVTEEMRLKFDQIKQRFPQTQGRRTFDPNVLTALTEWQTIEGAGGEEAIDEALDTIRATPELRRDAQANVSRAAQAVVMATAMNTAKETLEDIDDLDERSVQKTLAEVDRVAAELTPNNAVHQQIAAFKQQQIDGSPQQVAAARDLLTKTVDAARLELQPRFDRLQNKMETALDQAQRELDETDESDRDYLNRQAAVDGVKGDLKDLSETESEMRNGAVRGWDPKLRRLEQTYP